MFSAASALMAGMLKVHDLHTYYGDRYVLQGVTLHVDKGTVVAVLGRNGVGKTTLCRSIVGFTPARAGRIVFDDSEITHFPPHKICGMGISLVPQGRRIFASLTVQENLAIAYQQLAASSRPSTKLRAAVNSSNRRQLVGNAAGSRHQQLAADSRQQAAHGNDTTGPDPPGWNVQNVFAVFPRLAERSHHRGDELSGGEQQMLAIARALVANPVLLVMDEPTEGLAPALVAEVASLIRRLKDEGVSILLVEQNAAFAVKVADFVHVMSKGTIVHSSKPPALWENEEIKTQLLGVPGR